MLNIVYFIGGSFFFISNASFYGCYSSIYMRLNFFLLSMQLFRVLKRLYICELKNPEYLTLLYYVLHSLILYCTKCLFVVMVRKVVFLTDS